MSLRRLNRLLRLHRQLIPLDRHPQNLLSIHNLSTFRCISIQQDVEADNTSLIFSDNRTPEPHESQQPVGGSHIYLFPANTILYGAPSLSLLNRATQCV